VLRLAPPQECDRLGQFDGRTAPLSEERVIRGAEAIAEFVFGSHRRKVYYLAECSKIPIHRLGSTLCLRPSAYESWIESQEHRAVMNAKHDAAGEGAAPSSISERCENFHKARLTPSVSASTARRSQVQLSQKRIEPRRRAFFQRACLVRR
jgi:hypothetical protein